MGVKAHQHAMDLIAAIGGMDRTNDLAGTSESGTTRRVKNTLLNPSAQLMLANIALSFHEEKDAIDVGMWSNSEDPYVFYQGLGRRARALGYDLPADFQKSMVGQPDGVDVKLYRAACAASDRALAELESHNLIRRTTHGRGGANARYELLFLGDETPCTICWAETRKGARYADIAKHAS